MKNIHWALILSIIFPTANSYAERFEIHVLNGLTREKKVYIGGSQKFDIPIANVKGWSKCFAMPTKIFDFDNKNTMRGEVYCSSTSGNVVGFWCVASKKELDVRVQNLYGPNFKFTGADSISVDGLAEITVICDNL